MSPRTQRPWADDLLGGDDAPRLDGDLVLGGIVAAVLILLLFAALAFGLWEVLH